MLVLVTYDVNTQDAAGRRRLRQVAKACVSRGQRVQCSVFECALDAAQFCQLRHDLSQMIDRDKDSLRFYNLGDHYRSRIEHIGARPTYDAEETLMV